MPDTVVRVTALSKAYQQGRQSVTALTDVSLDLRPGEIVLLQGRSGSGKTTLLNVLAGWVQQDAGEVEWDWRGRSSDNRWRQVAIVPQTLGLLQELSIDENVGLALRLEGTGESDQAARVSGILERLEIDHLAGHGISEASLGERQRAAVARALVVEPRLLLADEPSAHQDVDRLHLVWALFHEAAERGTAVLAASHDWDALSYSDRVVELRAGQLIGG